MEWRCKTTTSRAGKGAVQPRTQAIDDGRFAGPIRPEKNNVEAVRLPNALRTIDQPAIFVTDESRRTSQKRAPAKLFAKTGEVLVHLMPIIGLGGSDDQLRIAGTPETRHLLLTAGGILPVKPAEFACPLVDR